MGRHRHGRVEITDDGRVFFNGVERNREWMLAAIKLQLATMPEEQRIHFLVALRRAMTADSVEEIVGIADRYRDAHGDV